MRVLRPSSVQTLTLSFSEIFFPFFYSLPFIMLLTHTFDHLGKSLQIVCCKCAMTFRERCLWFLMNRWCHHGRSMVSPCITIPCLCTNVQYRPPSTCPQVCLVINLHYGLLLKSFWILFRKVFKIYITEKDDGKNPTMIYQFSIPILSLFSSLFPFANITPCPLYYLPCSNRCGKLFHTKVPCISFPLFANLSLCQFICLYQISKLRGRNCEWAKFLIFLLENQNLW